jgi:CubicO group peptidase (beta-lactamase class C family)
MAERNVPSMAIAVAHGNKIFWEQGFGWADREKRTPADENTMYSLASVSKPLTATALMTLVSAGKIDLDKPIDDYLGAAKFHSSVGRAEDATVRRVANHISGMPEHFQFFYETKRGVRPL